MSAEMTNRLIGLAVFLAILFAIEFVFDRRPAPRWSVLLPVLRRVSKAPAPETPAVAVEPAAPPEPAGEAPAIDPARLEFHAEAQRRLPALFEPVLQEAKRRGCKSGYSVSLDGDREIHRLDVRRPDLPADQPAPFLAISPDDGEDACVLYGGVFPGPETHNGRDAEIGWRDLPWAEVEGEVRRFAERVFED